MTKRIPRRSNGARWSTNIRLARSPQLEQDTEMSSSEISAPELSSPAISSSCWCDQLQEMEKIQEDLLMKQAENLQKQKELIRIQTAVLTRLNSLLARSISQSKRLERVAL